MTDSAKIITKGYKATDKDMKCRGVQFVLGEWSEEIIGPLEACKNGYHFCKHASGVWSYYPEETTRIFEVECKDVVESTEPGADAKSVCRSIRLVKEITPGNTGDGNTGDGNTGNRNTGNRNIGNRNTGDGNTGNGNTGNRNTGYGNTGNRNAGDGNTGDGNTGDGNTGDGSATSYCSGFFCQEEQSVKCFDVDSGFTRSKFLERFRDQHAELLASLQQDIPITNTSKFDSLPGFTPEKLASLHAKHIAARKAAAQ